MFCSHQLESFEDPVFVCQVDLAIPSLGHRRGLLMAIQDLRAHPPASRPLGHWNSGISDTGSPLSSQPSPVSSPTHQPDNRSSHQLHLFGFEFREAAVPRHAACLVPVKTDH